MRATVHVSMTVRVQDCRRPQRAWVESLDPGVAFPQRPMDGSPVTEAACDPCMACVPWTFGDVWEQDSL
jgi:hypothetical protein